MRFMLDTNICIYLIKKRPVEVVARLRSFCNLFFNSLILNLF